MADRSLHAPFLLSMPASSRKRPTLEELDRAERVLHACGLRFDGYAYAEAQAPRGVDAADWLAEQRDGFTRTLHVPVPVEAAQAVFFAFQRGAKDYGWFLDRSAASLAGPFLFLHLYSLPVMQRWRSQDFAAEWDRLSAEEKEDAAAIVRRWLAWGSGTAQARFQAE